MLPFTYRRAPCKYCYANSLSALPIFICQRTLFFPISVARTLPLIGTDLENNVAKIRCALSPKCIETYRSVLKCIVTYRSVSKRIKVYRSVSKRLDRYERKTALLCSTKECCPIMLKTFISYPSGGYAVKRASNTARAQRGSNAFTAPVVRAFQALPV